MAKSVAKTNNTASSSQTKFRSTVTILKPQLGALVKLAAAAVAAFASLKAANQASDTDAQINTQRETTVKKLPLQRGNGTDEQAWDGIVLFEDVCWISLQSEGGCFDWRARAWTEFGDGFSDGGARVNRRSCLKGAIVGDNRFFKPRRLKVGDDDEAERQRCRCVWSWACSSSSIYRRGLALEVVGDRDKLGIGELAQIRDGAG
ncbi:hypothetical protein C1H46_001488 [Malus baccata]|uniref:Uncharacterized protein n=1 Tax=Malus baccata TaxID=106549 RepID=A0A540NP84_MALBA|nr:hypothetical protein C1H46_001488 [Malus baccata]